MHERPSQQLPPRAIYELLSKANVVSTSTLARASALAEDHHKRTTKRRLIGVAMNLEPWMVRLEGGRAHRHVFFDDVLFGIRMRADAGNADLLLLTEVSSEASGERTHYLDLCRAHGAEGLILAAFLPGEPELPSLASCEFPCVAIDTQLIGPRAGFISSDNVGGAATAVRHLAALGRKRIAFVGGWGFEPVHFDRHLGYESALGDTGLELREEYVMLGGWQHGRAHDLIKRVLELPEPPDAVFCASDVMAIGAMAAIEEAGLHIPEDVAVVGFDDCEYAAITTPRLTSVRQDLIGLGTASVEAILRMLDAPEDPPPSSVLPVELIVRESTAPPSSPPSDRLTPVSRRQANRFEIPSVPATAESASRLSPAALCRLLGDDDSAPRGRPGETSERTDTQKWHADRRRLVAVALDTAPDQSFRHAFFDELFYEIRARAYARGFDLVVITNVGTLPGEPFPPFLELCEKYRADGLLIISLPVESPPVAALSKSNFPCATLDVDLLNDTTAFVMSDNIGGGVKAVHHLIETGCHRIAFIGGSGDERPNVDRRFGYQSELARCGVPYSEEYVAMANWLPDRAFEATLTFLALPEPPDAIFCASDVMAIGAMAAIEEAGLRIPEDVAIVGFDDIDYARLVAPSLTTVRQSQDALAEGLIDGMLRLIEQPDETPQVSIVPVDLIVRDSTSGVPTHEPV